MIRDSTPFHWTHQHEKLFQSIKDRIRDDTILAVHSTDYPFHIHVDSKINHFRRLCLHLTQSLSSVEVFEPTYSTVNTLNTNEDDGAINELHEDDDAITDDNEDNLICEINTHADHYSVFKATAAHDAVFGKNDVSLAKQPLTATEAPHLDIKSLIAKLDGVAKTVDLMSPRFKPNKLKTQFLLLFDHNYVKAFHPM